MLTVDQLVRAVALDGAVHRYVPESQRDAFPESSNSGVRFERFYDPVTGELLYRHKPVEKENNYYY